MIGCYNIQDKMNIRGNYIVYGVLIGIFLIFYNPGFASSHEESIQLEADYILMDHGQINITIAKL